MLAIDTNVVVRLLVRDHPDQTALAQQLVEEFDILISTTVVLETAWVLKSAYGFSNDQIATGLTALAGLSSVTLDDPDTVIQAMAWVRNGLDFADALHLAQTRGADGFATFDRRLAKAGKGLADASIRLL